MTRFSLSPLPLSELTNTRTALLYYVEGRGRKSTKFQKILILEEYKY